MIEFCLKDKTIMVLQESSDNDIPVKIIKMLAPELLPPDLKPNLTIDDFNTWLNKRRIPDNREGLQEVKQQFGEKWLKNYRYLSLSDHYWIKHRENNWKSVSYFTRRYSPMIGDMFFKPWDIKSEKIDSNSPDLTATGVLKKRWIQERNLTSYLVKAASYEFKQEPLSEVLVSVLIEQLKLPGFKSAGYDLHIEGTSMCSKCKNIITPDTDLVTAAQFYNDVPRAEGESVYNHLIKMCEMKEIPGAREFIDNLIFIDRLTANPDRNLGNIAFLRDINTMKFIGPAPVFDCGAAYWGNKNSFDRHSRSELFHDVEHRIFNYVKSHCNIDAIIQAKEYANVIMQYPGLDDDRKEALGNAIQKRNNIMCLDSVSERGR